MFIKKNFIRWGFNARNAPKTGAVEYLLTCDHQILKQGITCVDLTRYSTFDISERFLPALWHIKLLPQVARITAYQYKIVVQAKDPLDWLFELHGLIATILAKTGDSVWAQVAHIRDGYFPPASEFIKQLNHRVGKCVACPWVQSCTDASKEIGAEPLSLEAAREMLLKFGFKDGQFILRVPDVGLLVVPTTRPETLTDLRQLEQVFGPVMPALLVNDCGKPVIEALATVGSRKFTRMIEVFH